MNDKPRRLEAIENELESVSQEYVVAKDWAQEAQVRFETAREKLAGIKRLATAMMPPFEWYEWQREHPNVRYVGSTIGEAITSLLEDHAYAMAQRYLRGESKHFVPHMDKDGIVGQLEAGGFDFRSTTPLREVHAALINLEGVTEDKEGFAPGWFKVTDAEAILERATLVWGARATVSEASV